MHKITVLFTTPHTWQPFSWLVKKVQKWDDASHCAVMFNVPSKGDIVYHARKWRTEFMSKKDFDTYAQVVHQFNFYVPEKIYFSIVKLCLNTHGTRYGFLQLMGAAFKLSVFDNGGKAYICTEVVAQVLKRMGYMVPHPERLTVYDVYKQCLTLKSLKGDES